MTFKYTESVQVFADICVSDLSDLFTPPDDGEGSCWNSKDSNNLTMVITLGRRVNENIFLSPILIQLTGQIIVIGEGFSGI